jgi:mRNA deadenylase 3'-5' endonuclease subunit Ccr4
MCLQEVDKKVFERYYEPMLGAEGFSGVFASKIGGTSEGSAVFFRRSVFRLHFSYAALLCFC